MLLLVHYLQPWASFQQAFAFITRPVEHVSNVIIYKIAIRIFPPSTFASISICLDVLDPIDPFQESLITNALVKSERQPANHIDEVPYF